MLHSEKELSCGIFDSSVLRKDQSRSQTRTVSCYELEIYHTDTGKSYADGESRSIRKGMLLCAAPGMLRRSDFPIRCGFIRLSAQAAQREGLLPILSALPVYSYVEDGETADELIALFAKLGQRLAEATGRPDGDVRANAMFFDLLSRIFRLSATPTHAQNARPASDMLHAAREYVNEHFTERCSLRQIAEAVNVSPNYLHAAFKSAFGETPYACVMRKRIGKAKKLIMAGQSSMLQIALETGFCSQSHFNKVFKQCEGITPRQFRNGFLDGCASLF